MAEIKKHEFVKWHFSSPRWCDTCGEFIWGVGKQGYKCSTCKYSCHSKCREGADTCGTVRKKNAEKGKGLSLGSSGGGPPYVQTLPNFSGFEKKEEHPLFKVLEDKSFVKILQMGSKGDVSTALQQGAQIINGVGALAAAAEGEFEDGGDEGGDEGGKGGKVKKVKLQYEVYGQDFSSKIMHVTMIRSGKKTKVVFKAGSGEKDKKKDKKKEETPVTSDGTMPKKEKKPAMLEVTQKKLKFVVSVGGKTVCSIRKHPQEKAFKMHYLVQGLEDKLIFDATSGSVADFSATFKISPPGMDAKIGKIKRIFKAVHVYKENCNMYNISFPKYASLDIKAIMMGLAMVLDIQEFSSSGSVLSKSANAVSGPVAILGAIGKVTGAGGE